jgi:hypothetical protein
VGVATIRFIHSTMLIIIVHVPLGID